jgi:hypothetical protein
VSRTPPIELAVEPRRKEYAPDLRVDSCIGIRSRPLSKLLTGASDPRLSVDVRRVGDEDIVLGPGDVPRCRKAPLEIKRPCQALS